MLCLLYTLRKDLLKGNAFYCLDLNIGPTLVTSCNEQVWPGNKGCG